MQGNTPLNASTLRTLLDRQAFPTPYELLCFNTIDSTNRFLLHHPLTAHRVFCLSETQTHGRGRLGRTWNSPALQNIYFSSRWPLQTTVSQLSGLSLVIALSLVSFLKTQGITRHLQVKWPNDVLWKHQKLAGILIEFYPGKQHIPQVIIGIGLNVNSTRAHETLSEKPWCSLTEITGKHYDRNTLVADLIMQLHKDIPHFITQGFSYFRKRWEALDCLHGQKITLESPVDTFQAIACGVSDSGELILQDHAMQRRCFSAGEVCLKESVFKPY